MGKTRDTLISAWEHLKDAAHERRRGSNFTFHRGILLILITSGTIVGLLIGIILSLTEWKPTSRDLHNIGYPGKLFTGALKSMNVPIVLSSVISAACSMEFHLCLKTVSLGLGLFIASCHVSAWLGLLSTHLVEVGKHVPEATSFYQAQTKMAPAVVPDLFLDLFR